MAKAWLMSCGDNPEANMASSKDTGTPDAGPCEAPGLNLSALVGELALFCTRLRLVGTTMPRG
eukprot:2843101-Pleurochrysis_carterae.AAC.1